ncbi:TonB-dependent receptor [Granulicella sibirica]|uniref:Oar protein n=1 Tax=Granulicella sibirica TaxID=2479048 RepID=A0A4Q0T480_9BACT|nr:TonB-dependent receptor [Granulicella sibirica]RXH57350.1 Oar protein [Granulicella sibirica]
MRRFVFVLVLCLVGHPAAYATVFGQVQGVVHDTQHRPVSGASVTIHAAHSAFTTTTSTNREGAFALPAVPLGDYLVTVTQVGFRVVEQSITLASNTTPVMHFELPVGSVSESVTVSTDAGGANINSVTPTALIGREDIAQTPGADRTNSLAMITDFVPGAYMTHDMLHMRGGHQVSWLLDGVQIPNTNIASNLGAQIDPKDIDYVEVQRGSYTSDVGDRTYGVFNVVPRTGFERNRQAELVLTAGSFLQTNDQLNFGDHTEKFAYYASLSGNRSDYGLSPPVSQVHHDASNGYGAFGSLIYNKTPKDQFRLIAQIRNDTFQIPYDPDPNSFENAQFDSSGLRDSQHERDGVVALSWLHTFNSSTVLQVSPFFHHNRADYEPNVNDTPVATTSDRTSNYGGAQASITTEIARNTLQAGFYSFGQHDSYLFGAVFNDGSGNTNFSLPDSASGGVVETFVSDNYKATNWLTLIAGLRQTHFQGQFSENEVDPRFGVAVRIPRLNWVFRGFYGRFYQPPPLLTAAGPVVQFAQANNTDFQPLHGERDEEHQFGVQIPLKGWVLDADTFKTRVNNFLDHSNIGDSSIYFPVTVDGALVRAWEVSLRSPRLWRFGQAHLAYSNQIAEQRGAITGGLICAPVSSPQCDADPGYTPVDHDQRNTLNVGFNASLPWRATASTNVYYGSGFVNGSPDPTTPYPNDYLPEHTTFDLAIGKSFGERTTVSVNALNVGNRRVLLDNSLTFGGFHYNDPREIYGEVRYRFHY